MATTTVGVCGDRLEVSPSFINVGMHMKIVRTLVFVVLTLVLTAPGMAEDKKKKEKAPPCPAAQRVEKITKGLTLTAEQKAKLDALKKDYGPKLAEAMKRSSTLEKELREKVLAQLTAEQKEQIQKKPEPKKGDAKKVDAKKVEKKGECKKADAKKCDKPASTEKHDDK